MYKVQETLLDRTVALKLLNLTIDSERIRKEVQSSAALKHPNIVQVFYFGQPEGESAYLVMELLEGQTLEQVFNLAPQMDRTQFREIFVPLLDALAFAHAKNIIHRDIKPGNIMLSEDAKGKTVKLLDLGIAKRLGTGSGTSSITVGLVGTPKYMSPEQCMGKPCDARSDIYSLCCVMYEAVSGHPPFEGETQAQVLYKHINEAAAEITNLRSDQEISRPVLSVIMSGLAKDPSVRPPSVEQLKATLLKALDSSDFAGQEKRVSLKAPALIILVCGVLAVICFAAAEKYIERSHKSLGEYKDRGDRGKGTNIIREECRLLRANGDYAKSAKRLVAVLNERSRSMNSDLKLCVLIEAAESFDDMEDYKSSEPYWRQALKILPSDMDYKRPFILDRTCKVLIATNRHTEAEQWCDAQILEAEKNSPKDTRLKADLKSIKAHVIMDLAGRQKEAIKLLQESLALYDEAKGGRNSTVAAGAGKDIYMLALKMGKPDLANAELNKTRDDVLNRESSDEGRSYRVPLNLSFFMESNKRFEDAIKLKKKTIEMSLAEDLGTREIPKWKSDIEALQKKLSATK